MEILITGASVAGASLAWWLARSGHEVTLVERAPAFREGGQNVDVRGAGREVVRRMGLEDAVRARGTGEAGIAFVDGANRVRAAIRRDDFGGEGPTAELEILRGDLARILFEAARGRCETVFGDRVASLREDGDGVEADLERGGRRRFDLVLVAEGIGSSTRRIVFGDAVRRRPLNLYMGWFTVPGAATDSSTARWFNAPGGRSVFLRPDGRGNARVVLTVRRPPDGLEDRGTDAQKAFLHGCFAGAGWEVPRLLAGMEAAEDFYFEAIGQVRMDGWTRGRVALCGDAAWCASPISGMGTTLALTGAYVLAGEISRAAGHAEAFATYERIMRPPVDRAQKVPSLGPRIAQPSTRIGIALQHALINAITSRPARAIGRRLLSPSEEATGLPAYA